ncbi:hypothetical protein ZIOFF_018377 [Zingiber officinale]|uniref:Uncharacterized protein n=1 Tax=Zingiber officinale TaxID=94328 RepID=A0A8J5LIR4_ZINOF|nr:hypothetical protein ZIOFF_018377 [Zingiber officinale]
MEAPAGANGGEGPPERAVVEESARLADRARELHDAAAALASRTSADEDSLRARALALESDLRRLRSSLSTAIKNREVNRTVAEKVVEEELDRASYALSEGDAAFLLAGKTQGKFLRMFLGPVNVRAARKDVQLKVKEEYNNYKGLNLVDALFVLLSGQDSHIVCSFSFYFTSSEVLDLGWVLPYIASPTLPSIATIHANLALRENVLRANGSDIRPWWIYHHYCAMLMALISLTWEIKGEPDCNFKQVVISFMIM